MKLALVLAFLTSAAAAAVETSQENQLRSTLSFLRRKLQDTNETEHCEEEFGEDHDHGDHPCHAEALTESNDACFSAFNSVEVQGKGMTAMNDITVGDYVRTTNNDGNDFSRVFSLAHVDHDVEADFLQIYVQGLEKPLEITANHMLYASAGKHVRAREVTVGDTISQSQVVLEIKSVKRNGVYAPITESGDIVVSGVRASSYNAFLDSIAFDQHVLIHFFFAPHRMICLFDFKLCKNEGHTDGYTNWAHWGIKIMQKTNEFVPLVQYFLAVLAFPFLSAVYGLEQMLLAPLTSLIVIGYMIYRKNQKVSQV